MDIEQKTHILLGLFVAALVAANLLGNKITTILGITVAVGIFSYPDFSDLLNDKLQLERLGAPSNPVMQDIYQETVRRYNEALITLMGSGGLLIVGLGVTIYGATKKAIPKRLVSPENRYLRHL